MPYPITMSSTQTAIALTAAVLAAAFVLSFSASPCDTADDRALCEELTGGAATWDEAMTNAIKASLERAKNGNTIPNDVASKLPADLKEVAKESLVSECKEIYEDVIHNLNRCIGFVESDPMASLTTYLSAVSFSDCSDGLKDFNVSMPEVDDFANEIQKLSHTLLILADGKGKP